MSEGDLNVTNDSSYSYKVIGQKSWLAYVGDLLSYFVLFILIILLDFYFNVNIKILVCLYALFLIMFVYSFMTTKSYKVAVNDEGVWLSYGILPWSKGGDGIRWRDMDMAFYHTNLISWLTNSYRISIKHKFTNSTDFSVSNIWAGKDVCNQIHTMQTDYFTKSD